MTQEIWKIFSLLLRGTTAFSRFILILFIAKYYSNEQLGEYSLFFTATSIGILLVGIDFYNFGNREVVYAAVDKKLNLLKDQLIIHLVTFSVLSIPFCLLLQNRYISSEYIKYFPQILFFVFPHIF